MSAPYHIIPTATHNTLVSAAYQHRGFSEAEAEAATRFCALAATHGIRTHNAIKALHLDELFGSRCNPRGCVPGAEVQKITSTFQASEVWNANRKLGQAIAFDAIDRCIELADQFGIGQVSVDNAFHYLWGGGYVMDAAQRGYIAYTNCTSSLAEVVPFSGKFPTLGTNPHSWGFPTTDAIGFPVVIDWATSVTAMGRVEQFKRENQQLPPNAAVDKDGNPTTDPHLVAALLPFGAHKGYGLALINELVAALIGGSLPTIRSRPQKAGPGEKTTSSFYFQVIHPGALSGGAFAQNRSQSQNIKAVLDDILGHGNEHCLLPGQPEAAFARMTKDATQVLDEKSPSATTPGLLFTHAEIKAFNEFAAECDLPLWNPQDFPLAPENPK